MDTARASERWRRGQERQAFAGSLASRYDREMDRVIGRYASVLTELTARLDARPRILEVGCGFTCVARLVPQGTKTYVDPLLPAFAQDGGCALPEGEKLAVSAESLPQPDHSFDCVICVNALDHMADPGQALREMARVLKPGGWMLVSALVHSGSAAALRRFFDRWTARPETSTHYFTLGDLRALLPGGFAFTERRVFQEVDNLVPSLSREEYVFVGEKQSAVNTATSAASLSA